MRIAIDSKVRSSGIRSRRSGAASTAVGRWIGVLAAMLLGWAGVTGSASAQDADVAFSVPVTSADVQPYRGRPTVHINGQATYWACHYLRHYYKNWRANLRASIADFNARGIHRFELHVDSGWVGVDGFDPTHQSYGYPLEPVLKLITEADPHAQLLLRIGADVTPGEWQRQFPDELERDHTGKTYEQSFASDVGFEALTGAFTRAINFVEAGPYAGHVVGYNLYLQFEGVPLGSGTEGAFTDYSPAMLNRWRHWLRERYGSDARLQAAWGDEAVTLAGAALPTPEEHLGDVPHFMFHHPVAGRKPRDYYELMDHLTVMRHRQLAQAAAEAAPTKLIGMMGGYSQDAGEPRSIVSKEGLVPHMLHKQHFSGPGPWGRAFEIPEIDFYFSCTDYMNTAMGGNCLVLTMPASLALHGKACMVEDDQRTHLHDNMYFNPALPDARATVEVHQRNAAVLYTEAGLSSWMEQAWNWLRDPPVLDNLGRLATLLNAADDARDLLPVEVCVLFDEESQGWTKPITYLDEVLFYHQRNEGLSFCGLPVRHHLLSDLAHEDFPDYKLYLLPNAYHWTAEKQKLIEKVQRDGNVLVWIYAPGYIGEDDFDLEAMQRATGMAFEATQAPWEHRVGITDFSHPITRRLPGNMTYGTTRHYGPLFRVVDDQAQVLGRSFGLLMSRHAGLAIKEFGHGARGHGSQMSRGGVSGSVDVGAGEAVSRGLSGDGETSFREAGDYASVYSEAPNLPAELLRELARYAGAHVYNESNDFIAAGRDLVAVHSAKPGWREVQLPRGLQAFDALSGEAMAMEGQAIHFELTEPGTQLIRVRAVDE